MSLLLLVASGPGTVGTCRYFKTVTSEAHPSTDPHDGGLVFFLSLSGVNVLYGVNKNGVP